MAAKGQTIEAEDVERVAHLIQPALDLGGFGGVMVTDALDAGLDFAEGHAGEMEVGVVNALKPGEHGAMGSPPLKGAVDLVVERALREGKELHVVHGPTPP